MTQYFRIVLLCSCLLITLDGCKNDYSGESYDPEGSTDTRSKTISYQIRKTWRMNNGDISFSNEFTGARLNDVTAVSDSIFNIHIQPENAPVNKSPWYAFNVWAKNPKKIVLQLNYEDEYGHRYYPDVSTDLLNWQPMDSARVLADTIKQQVSLILDVGPDTLYIGAQEIMTSQTVYEMIDSLENVRTDIIGYSTLGKPIPLVRFGNPDSHDIIVVLGRQHPPEATGFLALQAFVSRMLEREDSLTQRFLSVHQVLLIPMINPDGVDQGHWRHNAGGIDLNRDWNQFRQPETASIKSFFEDFMDDDQKQILFMIDFHSTQEDLFYVFDRERSTNLTGFTHDWLDEIESELEWYVADRVPTSGNSPVSTRWFYDTYNAEAVTYEVGDDSPRERIKEISSTAAEAMMELLVE